MTPFEIILLIFALAFVLLVIFLAKLLNTASNTLSSVQKQIEDLGHEPRNLVRHANEIAVNLNHKLKNLDPLFHTVANIGEALECKTTRSPQPEHGEKVQWNSEESKWSDVADLVIAGANLWQKIKRSR